MRFIRGSVFSKLLIIVLGMTIGVVLTMNILLSWFFRQYVYKRHDQHLWNTVSQVQEITARLSQGDLSEPAWERSLFLIDRSTGVHLAVFRGKSILASTTNEISYIISNPSVLDNVLALKHRKEAKILGVTRERGFDLLAISTPLDQLPGDTTLIAYTEVSNMREMLGQTLRIVWLASLLVLFMAIPLVYLVSRHFTHPLEEMQRVATRLADGDFRQRVAVKRSDEMGTLARALNEMAERLEQLENYRQEFLANVSHDLRTPLTSISGFIQGILDETIPEEEQKHYLSRVYMETQRLAGIANDLLDMARMREGQMEYHREVLDLWDICGEAVELLLPLANEKNVNLSLVVPGEPCFVYGDRSRLVQVLVNILDNSLKFARRNVLVNGNSLGDGGEVVITDDGPGILPEDLPHIFERFYRGSQGGTGLGLAISKLILDAHQGSVEVSSETGKGATFRIYLPSHKP